MLDAETWPTPSEPLLGDSNGAGSSGRVQAELFDVVVLVGSLGGPEAIREIAHALPAWFPAAVLVVQHRTVAAQHITVDLLRRATRLPVELARDRERPCPGVVYVLPADRQLVIGPDGSFAGVPGPRQVGCSADPLLTSIAQRVGPRALAVILSGTNDDGAAGVVALKRAGGCVLAQNRATARCFTMPAAAIATGCVDLVLPVDRLAHALVSLTAWPGAASLLRAPLAPWAVLD
jgi:two-component system chemotaxis response regulator CheB